MIKNDLLIKYDHPGDFEENQMYILNFDYLKSVNVPFLGRTDSEAKEEDRFLQLLDGNKVLAKYNGISKVDGMHMFQIDRKRVNRNKKLNDLLDD